MNELNWKELNINTIFDISYGNKLDMCQMEEMSDGIPFITRTATNNGIGGYVKLVDYAKPYPAGCLTVALGGSIGSTFLQNKAFYTSQNVAVLQPKQILSNEVLLFIATLIQKESNKRFIAFGRELNRHIKNNFTIKLPAIKKSGIFVADWEIIEKYINEGIIPALPSKSKAVWNGAYNNKPISSIPITLDSVKWDWFVMTDLFQSFERGKVHSQYSLPSGNEYFYVGAKKDANGVMTQCGYEESLISKGNCVIFICNGEGSVGYSNYMDRDFMASGDLILGYGDKINQYTGLFLCTILDRERPKYSFGRKYGKYVKGTKILLPTTSDNTPDWKFMENYIKSLPYSANI